MDSTTTEQPQTIKAATLTAVGFQLDVGGTPCNGSYSGALAATTTPQTSAPGVGCGVFMLTKDPQWSSDQMASIAGDLAAALRATAQDIEMQWGFAQAWEERASAPTHGVSS